MKHAIVVPTIRPELIGNFIDAWKGVGCDIIVVYDKPYSGKMMDGVINLPYNTWKHLEFVPSQTDCCRSAGFALAYKQGYDYIWSLDDDCMPCMKDAQYELGNRLSRSYENNRWTNTGTVRMRGLPYNRQRLTDPIVLQMGTWQGVLDMDGPTQLTHEQTEMSKVESTIEPKGKYFPMCGMNVVFRREITHCMYQLLMGQSYPFDRFGDIWSGIFMKKICDHLNLPVASGGFQVEHDRASNPFKNLIKEAPGIEVNEELWKFIDELILTENTVSKCYLQLADYILDSCDLLGYNEYWVELGTNMAAWTKYLDAHDGLFRL